MSEVGPFLFITARPFVAALTLAPFALFELCQGKSAAESSPFDRAGFITLGIMGGVVFFLGAALQQAGLQTATVTNAVSSPAFTLSSMGSSYSGSIGNFDTGRFPILAKT